MNLDEARVLVAEIRELDPIFCQNTAAAMNRKAEAWQPLLAGISYAEALDAARTWYASQRSTLSPGDVNRLVHDRRNAQRPSTRVGTCTHSSHAVCQACDATAIAAYLDEHPPHTSDARDFPPSGGGHRFTAQDGNHCDRCGLPEHNRRHVGVL